MSESEQAINVSEWKELHAELEEVSDKRNRLQTENNRLKALMQLTQRECDEVKNGLLKMTAERDHAAAQWEECCEDRSRLNGSANRIVQQLQTERNHAAAQLKECCEDRSRQVTALREQLAEMTAGLAEMTSHRDTFWNQRDGLSAALREMTAERDAVKEANGSQFRMVQALQRDVSQLQVERDAVSEQLAQANEAADMFEAENTYLRDTIQKLRAQQIHDDLPGILCAIQLAVEQARALI